MTPLLFQGIFHWYQYASFQTRQIITDKWQNHMIMRRMIQRLRWVSKGHNLEYLTIDSRDSCHIYRFHRKPVCWSGCVGAIRPAVIQTLAFKGSNWSLSWELRINSSWPGHTDLKHNHLKDTVVASKTLTVTVGSLFKTLFRYMSVAAYQQ